MSFGPFNRLLSWTSALVLASQSLPALSKTPTPPFVPNNKICAAVILKDDREGVHSDLMQSTITETLREQEVEERVPVFVTSMNKNYDEEQEIIKEIPKNVPVFVNQSFGAYINSEIVKKFIEDTLNNPKLDPSLLEAAQDLKTKYYKDSQWSLTLWDIREDPLVRLFVEDALGGLTTNKIYNFLSDHPNVTIFNGAGNGPNNQGTAQGGPPTVIFFSLIPKSLLPNNRFFMVAVGDNKTAYDNTAGSYLPSPGNPDRLPVVFQKPTNQTVEGPFYDEKEGYFIRVDFNGNGQATTRVHVSKEVIKAFHQSRQSAEVFFGWFGPNGSTSTATAQTTAQAAVAACQNPNAPVIPSLFDRIR
jgi:hypothetical protein